jgi:hypothetical protein
LRVLAGTTPRYLTDESLVDASAAELLVVGELSALRFVPMDHGEPSEVAAVRIEEADIYSLDPPLRLHASGHADEVIEDLEGALLSTAYRLAEPDKQRPIVGR